MLSFRPQLLLEKLSLFKNTRNYPLSSVWPSDRKSVVLILLFIGNYGELRVLLTKRSRKLRSFPGQVSLPGGKADNDDEGFVEIARREAEEEIGLPTCDDTLKSKYGMKIDNVLTELPTQLSVNFLSVKPIVCFLYNDNKRLLDKYDHPLDGTRFFGKLNPGETSAIFSVPLCDFACHKYPPGTKYTAEYKKRETSVKNWGGLHWKISHYYYSSTNMNEATWINEVSDASSSDEEHLDTNLRDVWGLTARILYELSAISTGLIDGNDKNVSLGNENVIYGLHNFGGQLRGRSRSDWEKKMSVNSKNCSFKDVLPDFYYNKLDPFVDSD